MKKMTLLQHFQELKRRIVWCFMFFIGVFCIGWFVAPSIEHLLITPLLRVWEDATMLYTGVTDGLMIRLSLSGLFALLCSIPFCLLQIWLFVAPGLKYNEKKFIWAILVLSPVLFILGALFAFYVLFPFVFKFFVEINEHLSLPIVFMPDVRNYLKFAIGILKVFGFAFQLPLVLVGLNKIGLLSKTTMIAMRSYAIVIIAIVAAVLTPPDIISQILLAVPMWLLFEISICFMKPDK